MASVAERGPATLAPTALTTQALEPVAKRASAPIGRLAGATPEPAPTPPPARNALREVASTSSELYQPAVVQTSPANSGVTSVTLASVTQDVPADSAPPGSEKSNLRKPKDVIRAVLKAQSAAWNEGNLQAFMNFYWKNDKLKYVVGDKIAAKGWSPTLRRYRKQFSTDEGMGRLDYKDIDVILIADDVAVVTGKYNIASNGANAGGAGFFSLVMQRIQGVWRIVHDHTVTTPTDDPREAG